MQQIKDVRVEVTDELKGTIEFVGSFESEYGLHRGEGSVRATWEISPEGVVEFGELYVPAKRTGRLVPLQEADYDQLRAAVESFCQRGGNLKSPF